MKDPRKEPNNLYDNFDPTPPFCDCMNWETYSTPKGKDLEGDCIAMLKGSIQDWLEVIEDYQTLSSIDSIIKNYVRSVCEKGGDPV